MKPMNIGLWILQALLAFWSITGAYYMMGHYQYLANNWALKFYPPVFWTIIGVIQIIFAVWLLLPGINPLLKKMRFISAIGLTLFSLFGIAWYVTYSGFPGMLWGLIPAAIAAFIAYGRWK
jgi:hypothetical protein